MSGGRGDDRRLRVVVPTWSVDLDKGGIRTYLTNVVAALLAQPDLEVVLLHDRRNHPVFATFEGTPGATMVPMELPGPASARPLAEQLVAHRIDRSLGDVAFVPSNIGLLRCRLPQVVAVQAPLAVPSIRHRHRALMASPLINRVYHRAMLGPSLRRAEHVVTVTEWLRGELLGSVPSLDPDRVVTVLEGCPSMPTPVRGRHAAATDGPPVVLFVSTLFPYKGAGELVGALAHLAAHRPELDWRARIVGADPSGGRITDELRRAIAAGGAELAGRVELVGRVPHEQIWDAYASAAVFVYPSRLETFGLPPLEAMASNVPVVASDAPAVAEVVGDAALVVDPTDAAALAGSIATALEDPEVRATLVARGRARTRALTWNAAAEQLAALLRAAAARIP